MGKKYRVGCKELDEFGKGKIVFNNRPFSVPYMLPGEKGEIELVFHAKETGAKLVSLDKASGDRVVPECPVYESCGGCQVMHMEYRAQLAWKQKRIEELFPEEAGKGIIEPILGMEQPWNYRHKIYASFQQGRKGEILAGIYEENSHRVVKTAKCRIQHSLANEIIVFLADLMRRKHILAYNEDQGTGVLRHVYIRVGEKTGQVMVVLVTGSKEFKEKKLFVEELKNKFPQITTIIHNINSAKTSMVLGKKETVLFGPGVIEDELCGLKFDISAQSFYQINPVQTEKLYETAVNFAELTGKETVLDAYCGIGTISMVAAEQAKEVLGVELNETACMDARKNAKKNNCRNVRFITADAGEYMVGLAGDKTAVKPEVVFMDPPRSGSDVKFIFSVAKLAPEKIVYISCNPVTQKADIESFKKKGYRVAKMQAVDCFCHTWHVENIALLVRN